MADWRAVRAWEVDTRHELRNRHTLWLHGWCIGLLVLGAMWLSAHLQMLLGSESLALRYVLTLGVGYAVFLLMLRAWAGQLLGREQGLGDLADGLDLPDVGGDVADAAIDAARGAGQVWRSGGGGDFGGGGADASFGDAIDGGGAVGELAGGALEAAAGADEAAVVVVPVAVLFLAGCLVLFGVGSLLLLYFGSEVLLAVAIEVAFSYVAARTAVRVVREGWVGAAVRLTWKPLLGAVLCAVLLGGLIDWFVPQAHSLPHAVKLVRAHP